MIKKETDRQNYSILAGEGAILRILKEIDKSKNRESIGAGIQKRFIHQRHLQIPMSGVQRELQLKEIIFRM